MKPSDTNVHNFIAQYCFSSQTLQIQAQGTNVILTWKGIGALQSSSTLTAGFSDITNAASPFTNFISATECFFRLRPN
jgi:hypothetical protein